MAAEDVRELEKQFDELSSRIRALEERVVHLEHPESSPVAAEPEPSGDGTEEEESSELNVAALALFGRTLIVLGGGFLLRMLTDSGILPKVAGVLIGLGYALVWLFMADRALSAGSRGSGYFHGLAASLVAYPLIWETTARFGLIGPDAAAVALSVVTLAALLVTARGKLESLGWTCTLLAVGTTGLLLVRTHDPLPFAAFVILLVIAAEWLATSEQAPELRWLPALAMDGIILAMARQFSSGEAARETAVPFSPLLPFLLGQVLLTIHLTSTGVRSVLKRCGVSAFDAGQTTLAMVVGVVALRLASPAARTALGGWELFLAAVCYAVAFGVLRPRDGLSPPFYYFSSAGALLGLVGSFAAFGSDVVSRVCLVGGVGLLWIGARRDRITLRYHGAVYLVVGAFGGRVLAEFGDGMLADAKTSWQALSAGAWLVLAIASAGYAMLVTYRGKVREPEAALKALPRLALAGLLGGLVACATARWLGTALVAAQSVGADAALLATVRTAVLVSVALACAWAGRRWLLRELSWLVWPTLVIAGLKLLREDFRYGRPLTLCLALVLYGGALILVPKLSRRDVAI